MIISEVLAGMNHLEELSMERNVLPAFDDHVVFAIAQAVPQLCRLHLSPSLCTNKAATALEQLLQLTHLTLETKHGLSAEALAGIAISHPGLQQLAIPHCGQVYDECLELLVISVPRLRSINISR
jgi:hypothetical protein